MFIYIYILYIFIIINHQQREGIVCYVFISLFKYIITDTQIHTYKHILHNRENICLLKKETFSPSPLSLLLI